MFEPILIQIGEGNCPKCEKGYISKREYNENQYVDFDVPVLDSRGNGMWEKHTAVVKNSKGETQYKNGQPELITWEEPTLEKIFVIKGTSHVNYSFCSNVLCEWFEKKTEVVEAFDV